MTQVSRRLLDNKTKEYVFQTFINAATKLSSPSLTQSFLQDLLTPTEQIMLAKRLCIAYMLEKKYPQRAISDTLRLSTTTITRVSTILKSQGTGYKQVIGIMLTDEKIKDFFNKLDNAITKITLPPKGNWSAHHKQLTKHEKSEIKPF